MREGNILMRVSNLRWIALPVACALSAPGCGTDTAPEPNAIPVLESYVTRSYTVNNGLVTGWGTFDWPLESGSGMDPIILEGRRFYDTLQAPNAEDVVVTYNDPFTGAPPTPHKTAPLTLEAWKTAFGIPLPNPGESLADYRKRTNAVVYYNKNELGLGRELGCGTVPDGVDANGKPLTAVGCYVSNYGSSFRDVNNSLRLAAEGIHYKNTVCISFRPSLGPDYEVQFYTYDWANQRIEWAQLDTLGPRPQPAICMNCHGGHYDEQRHLAHYAHFLPMDANVVLWPEEPGLTRADQEESIRYINALGANAGAATLTPNQRDMLDKLYGGNLNVPGTKSATSWFPSGWNDTDAHRDLFDKIIKPNCETCHLAMRSDPTGQELAIYNQFPSPSTLLNPAYIKADVCNTFNMPNSQATSHNFWEKKPEPIVFTDGTSFDSPADALLKAIGIDREQCQPLAAIVDCRRGLSPDDLCGNSDSGQACDRLTGRCVPELGSYSPTDRAEPNGNCKLDGTRGCPFPLQCSKRVGPIPEGLPGFDGVCIPDVKMSVLPPPTPAGPGYNNL